VKGVLEETAEKQVDEIEYNEQEIEPTTSVTALEVKEELDEEGRNVDAETVNGEQEQAVSSELESYISGDGSGEDLEETLEETYIQEKKMNTRQVEIKQNEKNTFEKEGKTDFNGIFNNNEQKLKQILSLFKNQSEVEKTKYIKLFNNNNKKDTILAIAHAKLNTNFDNIVNKLELNPDLPEQKILKNFTKLNPKKMSEISYVYMATCKIFYTKNFSRQFNDQLIDFFGVVKKDNNYFKDTRKDKEIEKEVETDNAKTVSQDTTTVSFAETGKKVVISETPENSLICNQCKISFEKRKFLKHHIQSVHNGFRYQCGQCDYKCKMSCNLKRHKESVHEGLTRFSCDKCDFQCYDKKNLLRHQRRRHEGIKDTFNCGECDFYFNTLKILKTHKHSVHGLGYNCDQCDHKTQSSSGLLDHKQRVHEGVMYMCDLCVYEATKKKFLTVHIESKHLNLKYICDLCGAQFGQKKSLEFHEKTQH